MSSEEKTPKKPRRLRLTNEERAAISRANGAKSRGPVTALGKSISRANGLTHGFRAEVVPLPGEEKSAIANNTQNWNAYYRPQSPGAQVLIDLCARADVMIKRSYQSLDGMLYEQVSQYETGAAASQAVVDRPVTAKAPGRGEPDFPPRTQPDPRASGDGGSFAVGRPQAPPSPSAGPPPPPSRPSEWRGPPRRASGGG